MTALATSTSKAPPTSRSSASSGGTSASPRAREPFIKIPNFLEDDPRFCGAVKAVVMAIIRHDMRHTGRAWPSIKTIASKAINSSGRPYSERMVQLAIKKAVEAGFLRIEPTKSNPTGREFILPWRLPPEEQTPGDSLRAQSISPRGRNPLRPPVRAQSAAPEEEPLPWKKKKEKKNSPQTPQGGAEVGEGENASLSQASQRQREDESPQTSPEPSDNPGRTPVAQDRASQVVQIPSHPVGPPAPGPSVYFDHKANGDVTISYMRSGGWLRHTLDAAGIRAMRADLGSLRHDHEAVGGWFADYEARLKSQGEQAVKVHEAATNEANLQDQYKAEGITLDRAKSVMGLFRQGGKLREQAMKYLTPLMRRFMQAQGGELAEFARDLEIAGVVAGPESSDGPEIQKKNVDNAVKLAALITEEHDRQKIDPLADELVACFGDPRSRPYYCEVGHALLAGELRQHDFRDELVGCLQPNTRVMNPAALFTSRIQRKRKPSATRLQAKAIRHLLTA